MDRREEILSRLLEIAKSIVGMDKAFRNRVEIAESARPAIIILDADELADEADVGRGRPPLAPRIVGMTPEIYMLLGETPENVGVALNTLRAAFIKAVLSDSSLVVLCHNGDIRYEGFSTGLAAGRSMEGECGVSFTFRYVLRPDKL
jgi:hypothetical protein